MLEQLHAGERLGNEHRRLQVLVDRERLALDRAPQELLRGDDAEHVVEPAPAHRIARVLGVADDAQHVVGGARRFEPDDLAARDHHRVDLAIVEAKHVAHHLVLLRLDHAGVEPFLEAGGDLFLGDAAVGTVSQADERQRRVGAPREHAG